jgi:putative oxidoreductase
MKTITIIARTLLGLIFVVFGSNAFLHFIPMPPPPAGLAGDFIKALFVSHYFYVVAGLQTLGGLILLSGRFTPLALTLLGPVIVNILCFHIFLKAPGLPLAGTVAVLALFLLWQNRSAFAGLLRK